MILMLALAAHAADTPEAAALAPTVADRCGPAYEQQEIRFTFVFEAEGVEKVRRKHVWRPQESTPRAGDEGWAAFVNDSYWLLAPCKVNDPGVSRQIVDGDLQLTFADVGLTPGDRYLLEVDDAGRVTGWSYTLESGREGAWTWTEHEARGPLELSMRRVSADGKNVIRFEDVAVTP